MVERTDFTTICILHVSNVEPKIQQHHRGGLRGLISPSRQELKWEERLKDKIKRWEVFLKNPKEKDMLKKRLPRDVGWWLRWDPMGRCISRDPGSQNQAVSSGFTAMTLWQNPLCCLGCKLRVHTVSWALTLKGSKTPILRIFYSTDSTLNLYYKASKKGRQMSLNWKSLGIILVCVVWAGWEKRVNMKKTLPRSILSYFL